MSLRGIAREIGIAAPSISAHFADMYEIIDAVTARESAAIHQAMVEAADSTQDPAERLVEVCRVYVRYGEEHPAAYQMLLGRRWMDTWAERDFVSPETNALTIASLRLVTELIQACVAAGRAVSADPSYTTFLLWFSLHGLITVRAAMASIEWPPLEKLLTDCVVLSTGLEMRPR